MVIKFIPGAADFVRKHARIPQRGMRRSGFGSGSSRQVCASKNVRRRKKLGVALGDFLRGVASIRFPLEETECVSEKQNLAGHPARPNLDGFLNKICRPKLNYVNS
jgi:hypothetical protein